MKAQWICKEKEFDFYLYNKLTDRRRERNVRSNVSWTMPAVDTRAYFILVNFELKEETTIHFYTEGEISLRIDLQGMYLHDFDGTVTLPAGCHTFQVEVYNPNGLPCLYVDGIGCESNEQWEVFTREGTWKPVTCCGLYDPKQPPSSFALPTREQMPVAEEKLTAKDGRCGILYTFEKEMLAFPKFINLSAAGKVELYYGESREEALDPMYSELCDTFCVKNGDFIGELSKAFRYVFIPFGSVTYEKFLCMEEYYPTPNRAKFVCNDDLLNHIYDVSLYTLALSSREFFIDGIKRDRWVWAGDAIQSTWMSLYSYFDTQLIKRTLTALLGKEKFYHHINGIMDYSFYLLICVGEYYRYTGDVEFIRSVYPQMKELLQFCLSRRNQNGLMQRVNGEWVFVDWAEFPVDGELCIEQILLYKALQCVTDLGDIIGEQHDEWRQIAESVRAQINEKYWTENGFSHDESKTLMTRYGGIFATLYGFADEKQKQVVLEKTLLSPSVQAIKTPYMKFYEMSALAELGEKSTMLEYIKAYWGGMINEGATTFWEEYDPNIIGAEKYAMYDRKYGKSLCHSWGAAPIYLLGRYIVGLQPDGVGYEKYILQPHLDGKLFFDAELPANDGCVKVKYNGNVLTVFSENKDGTVYAFGDVYRAFAGKELCIQAK